MVAVQVPCAVGVSTSCDLLRIHDCRCATLAILELIKSFQLAYYVWLYMSSSDSDIKHSLLIVFVSSCLLLSGRGYLLLRLASGCAHACFVLYWFGIVCTILWLLLFDGIWQTFVCACTSMTTCGCWLLLKLALVTALRMTLFMRLRLTVCDPLLASRCARVCMSQVPSCARACVCECVIQFMCVCVNVYVLAQVSVCMRACVYVYARGMPVSVRAGMDAIALLCLRSCLRTCI